MNVRFSLPVITLVLGIALGCGSTINERKTVAPPAAPSDSEQVNRLFDHSFEKRLQLSPELQTRLGIKTDYGEWDNRSDAAALRELARWKSELAALHKYDVDKLDAQAKLSFRLFEYETKMKIEGHEWRLYNYPVNQMHGLHAKIPAFLINYHRIDNRRDAEAYISRLQGVPKVFDQLIEGLVMRKEKGIMPPAFVYPHVLRDCENLLVGKPYDSGPQDSVLLKDFRKKIATLDISESERSALSLRASEALQKSVGPAYRLLVTHLKKEMADAGDDDGVWRLPRGGEFYRFALRRTTSTDQGPSEIHDLGLAEVARIHSEMRAIMSKVGFKGSLQDFFDFMRSDKGFYLPNTEEGRSEYLRQATKLVDTMRARLDELFITKPKAAMIVKRVEAFREQSAGKAFYSGPTPDGSRPGTYYANLYRMERMPTYQMEALAYHEGIPGHHMQIAIALELESIPKFRRHGHYTAYSEGWGLYSEYLPKEMGFYADPYSDFGRLAMELWRACRLVVDTGIHDKKWTRQEAIDYLKDNTPNPIGDVVNAIERYIVMPSQATAYKIGMLEILRLREDAKQQLGDRFDIREFHEVVLSNGPVSLTVLADLVQSWIDER